MHPAIKVGAVLKNKNGDRVEILRINLSNGTNPILGLIENTYTSTFTPEGKIRTNTPSTRDLDLEPILDLSKPIQRRDGAEAILLSIEKNNFWVAVKEKYNNNNNNCYIWEALNYSIEGKYQTNKNYDIVNS